MLWVANRRTLDVAKPSLALQHRKPPALPLASPQVSTPQKGTSLLSVAMSAVTSVRILRDLFVIC